ncbi:MAG: hypothetical protein NVSMB14_11940 [Isosphaeraceae bacterium]
MSTTSETIRFRCLGCDGLLNTARVKIGRIVICPRCRSEMIVPDPEALSDAEGKTLEFPATDDFQAISQSSFPKPERDGPSFSASGSEDAIALPIRLDPTAIRAEGPLRQGERNRGISRDRDVAIPRGALRAWALVAILALGLAFLAGLLTGRFAGG